MVLAVKNSRLFGAQSGVDNDKIDQLSPMVDLTSLTWRSWRGILVPLDSQARIPDMKALVGSGPRINLRKVTRLCTQDLPLYMLGEDHVGIY
jgi:hypothetical protein